MLIHSWFPLDPLSLLPAFRQVPWQISVSHLYIYPEGRGKREKRTYFPETRHRAWAPTHLMQSPTRLPRFSNQISLLLICFSLFCTLTSRLCMYPVSAVLTAVSTSPTMKEISIYLYYLHKF